MRIFAFLIMMMGAVAVASDDTSSPDSPKMFFAEVEVLPQPDNFRVEERFPDEVIVTPKDEEINQQLAREVFVHPAPDSPTARGLEELQEVLFSQAARDLKGFAELPPRRIIRQVFKKYAKLSDDEAEPSEDTSTHDAEEE